MTQNQLLVKYSHISIFSLLLGMKESQIQCMSILYIEVRNIFNPVLGDYSLVSFVMEEGSRKQLGEIA